MTVQHQIIPSGCDKAGSLASVDEALSELAKRVDPVSTVEVVPLGQACGRVLAKNVVATAMTPPFDNSAMDGYAVDGDLFQGDGPWTFPVSARVVAGGRPLPTLSGVARIFTGAPIPAGATAVVPQEDVTRHGEHVTFQSRPSSGRHIRRSGEDMRPGQVVVPAGAYLDMRHVAACAAAGADEVQVRRRLRVAIIVSGREVQAVGQTRRASGIWDINTPMLSAALNHPSVDLFSVEAITDCPDAFRQIVLRLKDEADLIVTTGGVSVGDEDHVKLTMIQMGAEIGFSGVALKPGKPVTYGRMGTCHWLGLPGNPLSAYVTWNLFGSEVIRRLSGRSETGLHKRYVSLSKELRRKPGRTEMRLARLAGFDEAGRQQVTFDTATHSGRVANLPSADGLIHLPAGRDYFAEHALVEFFSFCET